MNLDYYVNIFGLKKMKNTNLNIDPNLERYIKLLSIKGNCDGYTISDGIPGLLLLLAQFYITEEDIKSRNCIEKLAWHYLNQGAYQSISLSSSNQGLWTGPLGLSVAVDTWSQISLNSAYDWKAINQFYYQNMLFLIKKWSRTSRNELKDKFRRDIVFGFPGILNYVCNCHIARKSEKNNPMFIQSIQEISKQSLLSVYSGHNLSVNPTNLGMAHGLTGLIFSILQYNLTFKNLSIDVETNLMEDIEYIVDYAKYLLSLCGNTKYMFINNWCTGIPGLLNLLKITNYEEELSELVNYIDYEFESIHMDGNICLCHGYGSIALADYAFNVKKNNIKAFSDSYFASHKFDSYSMLTGVGGILALNRSIQKASSFLLDWLFGVNDFRNGSINRH